MFMFMNCLQKATNGLRVVKTNPLNFYAKYTHAIMRKRDNNKLMTVAFGH